MAHVINRGRQRQSNVIDLPRQWEFSFSNKKSLSLRQTTDAQIKRHTVHAGATVASMNEIFIG